MRILSISLLYLVLGLASINSSADTLSSTAAYSQWTTNAFESFASLLSDTDILYLAGNFTYIGKRTGPLVAVNTTDGSLDSSLPKIDGGIDAMVSDESGGFFIGGRIAGKSQALTHILQDGSVDPEWNPSISGTVHSMLLIDGTLFVGGYISPASNYPNTYFSAIDAASGVVRPWNLSTNGAVYTLAALSDTVYVGGNFSNINGQARGRGAAVNAITGDVLPWNPRASGTSPQISQLLVLNDKVYAGGNFTEIGGGTHANLAALDPTSADLLTANISADGSIYQMSEEGGGIYVVGNFSHIGSTLAPRFAAIFDDTAIPWNISIPSGFTIAGVFWNGTDAYVVSQSSNTFDGESQHLALHQMGNAEAAWDIALDGYTNAVVGAGQHVMVGGNFSSIGGTEQNYLAAIDLKTDELLPWDPATNDWVHALAEFNGTIYAGGQFTQIGGKERNSLAALDPVTGQALDWDPSPDSTVFSLSASDDAIFAAGRFSGIGGASRKNIAALDPETGNSTSWSAGNQVNHVSAMLIYNTTVLVCDDLSVYPYTAYVSAFGTFGQAQPQPLWQQQIAGTGHCLAAANGTLYLGGNFTKVGTEARSNLAALSIADGSLLAWAPAANDYVEGFGIFESNVYPIGNFKSIDGIYRDGIAAIDMTSGDVACWVPRESYYNNYVEKMWPSEQGLTGFSGPILTYPVVSTQSDNSAPCHEHTIVSFPHTADADHDGTISLSELLRVIQFYNLLGFHCADPGVPTEDGFAAGPGENHSCYAHDTDYNPPDAIIEFSELLRLIQFYNAGAYHYCPGQNSEDGFCPGV